MEHTPVDVLGRWWQTVAEMIETLDQAGQRSDIDIASFKAQILDLMLDAIKAGAVGLADAPGPLQERAKTLADRIAAYKARTVDVRLHLIALSQDWRCAACGKNVVSAAAVVSQSPLAAELVCRACGARTPLTPSGEARLQELFGPLAAKGRWNPALNGFASGRK